MHLVCDEWGKPHLRPIPKGGIPLTTYFPIRTIFGKSINQRIGGHAPLPDRGQAPQGRAAPSSAPTGVPLLLTWWKVRGTDPLRVCGDRHLRSQPSLFKLQADGPAAAHRRRPACCNVKDLLEGLRRGTHPSAGQHRHRDPLLPLHPGTPGTSPVQLRARALRRRRGCGEPT